MVLHTQRIEEVIAPKYHHHYEPMAERKPKKNTKVMSKDEFRERLLEEMNKHR